MDTLTFIELAASVMLSALAFIPMWLCDVRHEACRDNSDSNINKRNGKDIQ